METVRNEVLWTKAKRRAEFKIHLRTYLIINAGLWMLYLVTTFPVSGDDYFPWPIFPMIGWGIGLSMHYFGAYGNLDGKSLTEIEYQKLLRG